MTREFALPRLRKIGIEKQNPFVIAQLGATISTIVQKTYGSLNPLAVDLMKEFNPNIRNLDHIQAGERIWLPSFTRETLLRKEEDGSYRLIAGSFRSWLEAEKFRRKVKNRGFNAKILPRKVSVRIFLHRVEIERLQDLAAIDRAWDLVDMRDVSAEPSSFDLRVGTGGDTVATRPAVR